MDKGLNIQDVALIQTPELDDNTDQKDDQQGEFLKDEELQEKLLHGFTINCSNV